MKQSLIESLALELYYKAQTSIRSPRYNENVGRVLEMISKANKAGCPISQKIEATIDMDSKRICVVSIDDARAIAKAVVDYKEKTYTVTFRFPNGRIKTIGGREAKEVARLREKGMLISATEEK